MTVAFELEPPPEGHPAETALGRRPPRTSPGVDHDPLDACPPTWPWPLGPTSPMPSSRLPWRASDVLADGRCDAVPGRPRTASKRSAGSGSRPPWRRTGGHRAGAAPRSG